jgi:hypothetical protein
MGWVAILCPEWTLTGAADPPPRSCSAGPRSITHIINILEMFDAERLRLTSHGSSEAIMTTSTPCCDPDASARLLETLPKVVACEVVACHHHETSRSLVLVRIDRFLAGPIRPSFRWTEKKEWSW